MAAIKTKTARVMAALRGEPVDHVPVSAWWHDFLREWSAGGLADATLEAYKRYGWDYVKVNPRACYYAEDWGATYRHYPDRQPEQTRPAVSSPEHLRRIEPLDPSQGAYGEQLEALRLIGQRLGGEAPFIQTVFSPLAAMSRLTGSTKYVQRLMRENGDELLGALDAVTRTLAAYARECLNAGASGIFFATVEWGAGDNISAEDYERFARPFDFRVLEAASGAPFNVFHVCRSNNHLPRLLDYPAAAFHWDVRGQGNPSLRDILSRSDRAVMGGVSHERTMEQGRPEDVVGEAQEAIAETGGRRFLLAPGCSIEPTTPEANIRALVEATRR